MSGLVSDGPVLLVGAGKMGGALLEGWLKRGVKPERIAVADPAPPFDVARLLAEKRISRDPQKFSAPAAIVLAVKPQAANEAMLPLRLLVKPGTVVISIMAGRTLASLGAMLPPFAAIVRAMPNLPASIGRGITVAVANARTDATARTFADDLLLAVGEVEWVEDEALLDPVTAVSGSGPAYVFLLAEALANAGQKAGLSAELATKLARATIAGSGELLGQSELSAAQLRENVTSRGGTTEAAFEVLLGKDGLQSLFDRAVAAATKRSKALRGG
jgi:pyrroline-5-carboxylate reductase